MKLTKRLLSIILTLALILTCIVTTAVSASAAKSDKVYCRSSFAPNCYMWSNATQVNNSAWPGVAMTSCGENVYCYEVPSDDFDMIIFNGGGSQTADMNYPGNNMLYDYSTKQWEVYDISAAKPSVASSKKSGSSFATDTIEITLTVKNATSAFYKIDNGAQVAITGESVNVTIGQSVAVGSTTSIFVSAENANGKAEETYTYTKKQAGGSGDDGHTTDALSGYYATNPDGKKGVNKTISIDGDISDWDSSMLIAQGTANDDPRVYRPNSMYEIAIDDYALYAAWDNDNLYLMWEMANLQDDVAPNDNFPISQGNAWIYNLPVFIALSTDPSLEGDGSFTTASSIWDSGITFDAHIDTLIAFSTNGANGPFIYQLGADDKFDYDTVNRTTGIELEWGNQTISEHLYGIDGGYGEHHNRVPGDTLLNTSAWKDFYGADSKHSKELDMFYEMSIPLANIGITKSEIESSGIGVMKVSTFGTSGMDCLPYDPSMSDNAAEPYSAQEPNSHEKEDIDHITVPLARIGSGEIPPAQPTQPPTTPPDPTQQEPTEIPTTTPPEPTQITTEAPSNPHLDYKIGDADCDGIVTIIDATMIQRHLAKMTTLTADGIICSDVDHDNNITILDATMIQLHLAGKYTIV